MICGSHDEPYAQKTDLGWSIVGSSPQGNNTIGNSIAHRIITSVPDDLRIKDNSISQRIEFVYRTSCKEIMSLLESDFTETRHERTFQNDKYSQDDIKFLHIIESGIHLDPGGFYEMPLPFVSSPKLPNNMFVALKRLDHLKKRLMKDKKYCADYTAFMDDIIDHNYAEPVHNTRSDGWYLPHHGVYHKKKPDKIRVVFDCGARFKDTSLNEQLLSGPDLLNSLTGVLCRFREHPVAVMCDIEKMFYRFRVNEEHRKFLKFLWWKDSDLSSNPISYQMNVHIFGAASSPACANFALKRVATDHKRTCSEETFNFLTRNVYVDDGLTSVQTVQEASRLVEEARSICNKGQLRLHKFVSNERRVLEKVPSSERASSIENLDLDFESLPMERALGIKWCVESDELRFSTNVTNPGNTRRQILSTIASLYDPLGLLSPFVLLGKLILQEMCRDNLGWDDPISDVLKLKWKKWLLELDNLVDIRILRCIQPAKPMNAIKFELHHFSDASLIGYGSCSYLRVVGVDTIHCSLLFGKSRVAPTKIVTIPRLELTAALLSVKISVMLRRELSIQISEEFFWTDSKIVLGYLKNDARKYHVFVANRIQQIKNNTDHHQWNYVPTQVNPADMTSRGAAVSLLSSTTWLKGPKFLWERQLPEPSHENNMSISADDPNVRIVLSSYILAEEFISVLDRFSSWFMVQRVIALCRKFIHSLKLKIARKETSNDVNINLVIDLEELANAKTVIVKVLQHSVFSEEIQLLNNSKLIPVSSKLHKLDIFLDDFGVLRVGGRLQRSTMCYEMKHPIILPRKSHITVLIIRYFHERIKHQGRGFTINEIRANGYWIIGCSRAVSSYIYSCVTCRKLRSGTSSQKMSTLPEVRLEQSPPFSHIGCDCFGPYTVKEGRRTLKKYGLLVTCLACRAIHVEILDDMTTDAFINALRCVIAIRGNVQTIRCDRGSNFTGAAREFNQSMKELDEEIIHDAMLTKQCQFVFNSPDASHMGGVWERQIRSIRSILNIILYQHPSKLDTSSLRTFFYEVMAIVNGRPLTAQNLNSPDSPAPLTPNHLITQKSTIIVPPPGNFSINDTYLRKRWRLVQHIANEFWNRFRKEYLVTLQPRQKWNTKKREPAVGDVVIVKDVNTYRGDWSLARVRQLIKSSDGLVRRVKLTIGNSNLDNNGTRQTKLTILERPVHKLVLLVENS